MIYSSELIKGTLKTIILKLLKDNKRMYGYEITQTVKELTAGKIQLTEGALYPSLHALEADGLLTTETEYIGKRVRKYYSLSQQGKIERTVTYLQIHFVEAPSAVGDFSGFADFPIAESYKFV